MPFGLYIHVPFCLARCDFCAFYLQILRTDKAEQFVRALSEEIRLQAHAIGARPTQLDTVYFGGGTPTTLTSGQLCQILEQIRRSFGLREGAEVCLEAHPNTVSEHSLRLLADGGFTRISFGVQSAVTTELVSLGRPASTGPPAQAIIAAKSAGFTNINLDLMYGLPEQTLKSWLHTLEAALALEPTHISCYALTVESRTKLNQGVQRGTTPNPDPAVQNTLEEAAGQRLHEAGFQRYEISNYCRPGFACRHNLLYWQDEEYLGLGPSAQSFWGGCRMGNVEHLSAYVDHLTKGRLPIAEHEPLAEEQRRREAVVFGLRMIAGVNRELVDASTDTPWKGHVGRLLTEGLLEERGGHVRLTAFGRRYADSIAVELL